MPAPDELLLSYPERSAVVEARHFITAVRFRQRHALIAWRRNNGTACAHACHYLRWQHETIGLMATLSGQGHGKAHLLESDVAVVDAANARVDHDKPPHALVRVLSRLLCWYWYDRWRATVAAPTRDALATLRWAGCRDAIRRWWKYELLAAVRSPMWPFELRSCSLRSARLAVFEPLRERRLARALELLHRWRIAAIIRGATMRSVLEMQVRRDVNTAFAAVRRAARCTAATTRIARLQLAATQAPLRRWQRRVGLSTLQVHRMQLGRHQWSACACRMCLSRWRTASATRAHGKAVCHQHLPAAARRRVTGAYAQWRACGEQAAMWKAQVTHARHSWLQRALHGAFHRLSLRREAALRPHQRALARQRRTLLHALRRWASHVRRAIAAEMRATRWARAKRTLALWRGWSRWREQASQACMWTAASESAHYRWVNRRKRSTISAWHAGCRLVRAQTQCSSRLQARWALRRVLSALRAWRRHRAQRLAIGIGGLAQRVWRTHVLRAAVRSWRRRLLPGHSARRLASVFEGGQRRRLRSWARSWLATARQMKALRARTNALRWRRQFMRLRDSTRAWRARATQLIGECTALGPGGTHRIPRLSRPLSRWRALSQHHSRRAIATVRGRRHLASTGVAVWRKVCARISLARAVMARGVTWSRRRALLECLCWWRAQQRRTAWTKRSKWRRRTVELLDLLASWRRATAHRAAIDAQSTKATRHWHAAARSRALRRWDSKRAIRYETRCVGSRRPFPREPGGQTVSSCLVQWSAYCQWSRAVVAVRTAATRHCKAVRQVLCLRAWAAHAALERAFGAVRIRTHLRRAILSWAHQALAVRWHRGLSQYAHSRAMEHRLSLAWSAWRRSIHLRRTPLVQVARVVQRGHRSRRRDCLQRWAASVSVWRVEGQTSRRAAAHGAHRRRFCAIRCWQVSSAMRRVLRQRSRAWICKVRLARLAEAVSAFCANMEVRQAARSARARAVAFRSECLQRCTLVAWRAASQRVVQLATRHRCHAVMRRWCAHGALRASTCFARNVERWHWGLLAACKWSDGQDVCQIRAGLAQALCCWECAGSGSRPFTRLAFSWWRFLVASHETVAAVGFHSAPRLPMRG